MSDNFNILTDPFYKLILYLGRPSVQIQLTAILLVVVASWLASRLLGFITTHWLVPWLEKKSTHWFWLVLASVMPERLTHNESDSPHWFWLLLKHVFIIIKDIAFPSLALFGLNYVQADFINNQRLYGLLSNVYFLFGIIFIYRLIISLSYQLFGPRTRRYHYRLAGPIFGLYIFGYILTDLVDFYQLANFELLDISSLNRPLTLGSLFLGTVGLYFWIDSILGLGDILQRLGEKYTSIQTGTIEAMLTPIRYILISGGILVAFSNLGLSENTLTVITGGLSVGIGFGMQEVISNFISGLMLIFEQSLRPGDVISIDGQIGKVRSINIRSTVVSTLDDVDLIIPNQTFFTSTVTSYTRGTNLIRLSIPLEVSETSATPEFLKHTLEILEAHPEIQPDSPEILITGFGPKSVIYALEGWISDVMIMEDIKSDVYKQLWQLYPQYDFLPTYLIKPA